MAEHGTGGNANFPTASESSSNPDRADAGFCMTKHTLRATMRKRRRSLSMATQNRHGQAFLNNLQNTRHYQQSRKLACYMPVSGELDTMPFMLHALASGKQVYLPVIENSAMWFCRWHGESLPVDSASGLPQPLKRQTRLPNVRQLDLVVVPLVAFTREGARLGQGGGYYDRTFAFQCQQAFRRPTLIGAAHHIQETEFIPTDPWDVPLFGVVTNRETLFHDASRCDSTY